MTRRELKELTARVYVEAHEDAHWMALILHRPVDHLRAKGYKVTRLGDDEYEVEEP